MIVRKPTRFSKASFIKRIRARYQFTCVGSGLYARVFSSGASDFVYKIMTDDEEAEGYRAFVVAASNCQSNPWFPKIYSATVYRPKRSEPYLVVRMEKLREMSDQNAVARLAHNLHKTKSKALKQYQGNKHFEELRRVLNYLYAKYNNDLHSENIMVRGTTNHPVITDPVN